MRRLYIFFLLNAALLLPSCLWAWSTEGHRICGQIAYSYLTTRARQNIKAILGTESLAVAGNWADNIKNDPNYHYLQVWHYVDIDKVLTYPQMAAYLNHDNQIDAYTRLNFLIYKLRQNQLTSFDRRMLLYLLIHLVEDLHQPLHTGHNYDRGGNNIEVRWFGKPTNLHAVWDYQLINYQRMGYKRYAAVINNATPQQVQQWQQAPISLWVYESNIMAQKIYKSAAPGEMLDSRYEQQNIGILDTQLLKAGVRLAGLLNQLFG